MFSKIEVTSKIERAMLEKLAEGLKQVFIDCPNLLYYLNSINFQLSDIALPSPSSVLKRVNQQ